LGLAAFDHLSPSESDGQSESHPAPRRQFPSVEYETSVKTLDSISYGNGISIVRPLFGDFEKLLALIVRDRDARPRNTVIGKLAVFVGLGHAALL
jgi:hypothetical protein